VVVSKFGTASVAQAELRMTTCGGPPSSTAMA
jgi:bifunctional ADP-heptose synthase (sugar kinase/adenylyltransferase)